MLGQRIVEFPLQLAPLPAERSHHHRLDDQQDVRLAGVVRADLALLTRIEQALEERAEDARLDAGPIAVGDPA